MGRARHQRAIADAGRLQAKAVGTRDGAGNRNHAELARHLPRAKTWEVMRFFHLSFRAVAVLAIQATSFCAVRAQSPAPTDSPSASTKVMITQHAKGAFEVTVKPVAAAETGGADRVKRMTLDKQFSGDLTGTGKGEMLTSGSPNGSGAYVAIEEVTGTLGGRKGSFVFQHSGTMTQGALQLTITVVPGSGTGELAGLAGTFKIDVVGGKHFYDFEYTLPQ